MILTNSDALAFLKNPKNGREIARAKNKRIRHALHTEPDTDTELLGPSHQRFLKWVKDVLRSEENYERFLQLYRPPIFTNELTESIFSEFEKVFEAENAYEKINFTDNELELDFNEYRKRKGDFHFWETQGFETFKNSIDNMVVIDLPKIDTALTEQTATDTRPEPYYYILDIDNIIDVLNVKVKSVDNETGEVVYFFKTEYLIFRSLGDLAYVIDDERYRWYTQKDGNYTQQGEAVHNLGYCPARSFWTTPLNSKTTFLKRSPITNSISEMDWLLFFSIARKYLELYAPFPLYAVYKGVCNYKEEGKSKGKCVDGYLLYEGGATDIANRKKCPRCSNKFKVGPGNIIELRMPKDKEDPDVMANPMKVIPAEVESLTYMKEALKEKRDEIFANCVGFDGTPQNEQAKNTLQIQSSFESRTSVLLKIKRNFEIIHSFTLNTIARLRYGDSYIGLTIDYGDEFFVKDETTQTNELEVAKKNGAPSYELASRRQKIWETMYRNNPEMIERLNILHNLEPYPDNSLQEVVDIRKGSADLISTKDLVIKLNFNSFIDRFEREQTSIGQFGSALMFDKKISLIKAELSKYADEYIADAKVGAPVPPAPVPVPAAA
jgi:hypothetical protein